MTSMDSARRFLAEKSRAMAVTIIPLAAFMLHQVPARALSQVPLAALDPETCTVASVGAGANSSGACVAMAQTASADGIMGVRLQASNRDLTPVASSASGGLYGVSIIASGGTTGNTFGGTLPVSWNFTPVSSDGGNLSYELIFSAIGTNGASIRKGDIDSFSVKSGTVVSGSSSIKTGDGSITGYRVSLQVMENNGFGGPKSIIVGFPANSLNIFPPPASPKPGTMFLFGGGLAALLFLRLRR
jgi:hypothetical protein